MTQQREHLQPPSDRIDPEDEHPLQVSSSPVLPISIERERLQQPITLILVRTGLPNYTPPEKKVIGGYYSKAPLIDDFNHVADEIRLQIEKLPEDMPHELKNCIEEIFTFGYQHPLPNSIDALYKAIDSGDLELASAAVEFEISLNLSEPPTYTIRTSDNGTGFSKIGFERLSTQMFVSSKDRKGRNIGGEGESYARLLQDCGRDFKIHIETLGEENLPKALTITPDPKWLRKIYTMEGARQSRGTDVEITRPLNAELAAKFRAYYQKINGQ